MPKRKTDETTAFCVVALPDGTIFRSISKWHATNVLVALELKVRLRQEAGVAPKWEDVLAFVAEAKDKLLSLVNPMEANKP